MKQLSFFSLLLAATMFFGCGQTIPEVEVEDISLNKTLVYLEIGCSFNLTATIYPSNATNKEITWSSSKPSVVMVDNNGKITALLEGSSVITATTGNNKTATCEVITYISIPPPPHSALCGTNYYIIFLPEGALDYIKSRGDDKIIADFTTSDVEPSNTRLWIWEDSYIELQTFGVNSFGVCDEWMKLEKVKEEASGTYTCYNAALVNSMKAISDDINNYFLHIAYKSMQPNSNTIFELNAFGVADPQPSVVLGKGINSYINKAAYGDFHADGEWNSYDIPMTYFANQGLVYKNNFTNEDGQGQNIFTFRSLGTENPIGTTVEFDAVFIYKKAK